MEAPAIHSVSDTAFMVAAHRAVETQRPDALFRDPLAERLAGDHGREVVRSIPRIAAMTGWLVVVRTCIIDDFLVRAIAQGADTVLNLGAGLDTRPYRMTLPASVQWVEADYPHVIELKDSRLAREAPTCRLRRVGVDLTDLAARQSLFDDVASSSRNVVILTEGVVPYLDESQAATLADDLRVQASFRHWIVDYFSPLMHKLREWPDIKRGMKHAPWLFQPRDYFGFFVSHGWRVHETRYIPIEAQRLNRPPPLPTGVNLWLKLLQTFAPPAKRNAFLKLAGYVWFEPA